jgi:hypothetical protein
MRRFFYSFLLSLFGAATTLAQGPGPGPGPSLPPLY